MTESLQEKRPFKILSIDGGGIRGIMPARFLAEIEEELERREQSPRLHDYFDMICGTSTGGIIALALSLGVSSREILTLYKEHASGIFHKWCKWTVPVFRREYASDLLLNLLKDKFKNASPHGDTRLGHAKAMLCIPTYNSKLGKVHVYKTPHHPGLTRDCHIPAHHVAMSTAAAPTFFSPHSFTYANVGSTSEIHVEMNVDGGVIANNPTLIGIMEAHHALKIPMGDMKILSLGTGHSQFMENNAKRGFGYLYWLRKKRLIDLMFSAQAQNTDNLIKFMNNGLGQGELSHFFYKRVQHQFPSNQSIDMDETNTQKLLELEKAAVYHYKENGAEVLKEFLMTTKREYIPTIKF